MNYLMLSGELVNGHTYGSDKVFASIAGQQEIHRLVSLRYQHLHGKPMPHSLETVAEVYLGCRKGNYERLRDGKPICRGTHAMPLFPGGEEVHPDCTGAVIYAYWGRNQIADRRLVKVGWTSEELTKYLRGLARAYDPKLMASCCGEESEEKALHVRWRRYVAEGREWYWATETMFSVFRNDWRVTEDFDYLVSEALRISPYG